MNELIQQDNNQPAFARMLAANNGANHGAIAIEQERAIAEAQGQLTLAKRFPRSVAAATAEFMESCKSPEFAAQAFYSVPNRGSGPSIRFAEEAARCYSNFIYGHRELSRSEGKSEIEVYAWDMEKNNRSTRQITVMHVIDTKNGPKPCRDQAEIDNLIANKASKQMRGRILALMPKHMLAMGQEMCKRTLAGGNEKPLADRINSMIQAFGRYGVGIKHVETYLGHSIDNTTTDELADLIGIFTAIKEGAKASEYFPLGAATETADTAAQITAQAKAAAPAAQRAPRRNAAQADSNPAQAQQSESAETQAATAPDSPAAPVEQAAPPAAQQPAPAAADSDDVF